jgi:hypothetical protein
MYYFDAEALSGENSSAEEERPRSHRKNAGSFCSVDTAGGKSTDIVRYEVLFVSSGEGHHKSQSVSLFYRLLESAREEEYAYGRKKSEQKPSSLCLKPFRI